MDPELEAQLRSLLETDLSSADRSEIEGLLVPPQPAQPQLLGQPITTPGTIPSGLEDTSQFANFQDPSELPPIPQGNAIPAQFRVDDPTVVAQPVPVEEVPQEPQLTEEQRLSLAGLQTQAQTVAAQSGVVTRMFPGQGQFEPGGSGVLQQSGVRPSRGTAGPRIEANAELRAPVDQGLQEIIAASGAAAAEAARVQGELLQQEAVDQATEIDRLGNDLQESADEFETLRRESEEEGALQLSQVRREIDRLRGMSVDPDRFYASRGSGARVLGSFALAMGHLGQSLNPSAPNLAANVINQAIENDIQAQLSDIDIQGNVLSSESNMLQQLTQQYENQKDAVLVARAMQLEHSANRLQGIAARTRAPMMQAQAEQASALLRQQAATALAEFQQNRSRVTFSIRGGPGVLRRVASVQNDYNEALQGRRVARTTRRRVQGQVARTRPGQARRITSFAAENVEGIRRVEIDPALSFADANAEAFRQFPPGQGFEVFFREADNVWLAAPTGSMSVRDLSEGERRESRATRPREFIGDFRIQWGFRFDQASPEMINEATRQIKDAEFLDQIFAGWQELQRINGSDLVGPDRAEAQAISQGFVSSAISTLQDQGALTDDERVALDNVAGNPFAPGTQAVARLRGVRRAVRLRADLAGASIGAVRRSSSNSIDPSEIQTNPEEEDRSFLDRAVTAGLTALGGGGAVAVDAAVEIFGGD